jgi:hypothetical protein
MERQRLVQTHSCNPSKSIQSIQGINTAQVVFFEPASLLSSLYSLPLYPSSAIALFHHAQSPIAPDLSTMSTASTSHRVDDNGPEQFRYGRVGEEASRVGKRKLARQALKRDSLRLTILLSVSLHSSRLALNPASKGD